MLRMLVFIIVGALSLCEVRAEETAGIRRMGPSLTVELISKKREFKVGEQWVGELKATATAPVDEPMTIRAWSRFFANYDVVSAFHGPIDKANLSDVLGTGGQVWRDGVPVVLWNSPALEVFHKAAETKVPAGTALHTTFTHHFGSAVKPGRFRQKLWFAVVVEPSPNHFMLLFAREPIDVEFIVQGDEIDFPSHLERTKEWFKINGGKLHDRQSIQGENTASEK